MLNITDLNIYLTRGDSCSLICNIKDAGGNDYVLQTGDILTFTIKRNCNTDDVVIQKITAVNTIAIEPSDTNDLSYGKYVYDIQLNKLNGDVYTVIAPHIFEIGKEVTFYE